MECFYKMKVDNVEGESPRSKVNTLKSGLEWIQVDRDPKGVLTPVMALTGFKVSYIITDVLSHCGEPHATIPDSVELGDAVSLEDLKGDATVAGVHRYLESEFLSATEEQYYKYKGEKPFGYSPDSFFAAITFQGHVFAKIHVVDSGHWPDTSGVRAWYVECGEGCE